jgi:hypothetical protein
MDYLAGAGYQYLDDMSLGLFSDLIIDLDTSDNAAFQEGRETGRVASTIAASADQVLGAATTGAALAAMAPTAGAGAACALASGGVCAVPAGGALLGEAAVAAAGVAGYAYGTGVIAFAKGNPVRGKIGFSFQKAAGFSQDVLTKGYHINSDIGELSIVAQKGKSGYEWIVSYAGSNKAVPGSTAARAVDFLMRNSAAAIARARGIISTYRSNPLYAQRVAEAWDLIHALGGQ